MRSTRALVFGLTPTRSWSARSTVPMEVPRASAISRIPATLSLLSAAFIVIRNQPFPHQTSRSVQIHFDSESWGCVVLLPVTYTLLHLLLHQHL